MKKPLLLDLFCGEGGASAGYHRAGFDVVGIDHRPQSRYPFLASAPRDALETLRRLVGGGPVRFMIRAGERVSLREQRRLYLDDLAAIHASPPCQRYSKATPWRGDPLGHPDLIAETRALLAVTGRLWVIENVEQAGAVMSAHVLLCGSMFGLRVRRHRLFELSAGFALTPDCRHRRDDHCFDHGGKQAESVYRDAMGCDWMSVAGSRQAIPPAYTEWLGRKLLEALA